MWQNFYNFHPKSLNIVCKLKTTAVKHQKDSIKENLRDLEFGGAFSVSYTHLTLPTTGS